MAIEYAIICNVVLVAAEVSVTATWTTLHPDRPVTIGQPLPTYTTVILDRADPHHALPHGSVGKIEIAGIGLAAGYRGGT